MSKEAMKLALEALEGAEALLLSMGLTHLIVYGDAEKAITALREALAEQHEMTNIERHERNLQKFLAEQPAQQEPVERGGLRFYTNGAERQHWKADGSIDFKDKQGNVTMTIAAGSITSPQPSKPLMDEQIDHAIAELGLNYFADAANNRAVLRKLCRKAAHGIKENT